MAQRTFSFDRYLTGEDTLDDFLLEQLRLHDASPREKAVAEYIIGNIDYNGYLSMPLAQVTALGVSEQEAAHALSLVQQFEPAGVAARNLAECLILQLERKRELTPALERLIKNHLNDFETLPLLVLWGYLLPSSMSCSMLFERAILGPRGSSVAHHVLSGLKLWWRPSGMAHMG
ncbi:MAG: hypothetical protein RR505_08740 [Raoultibacter sp.]